MIATAIACRQTVVCCALALLPMCVADAVGGERNEPWRGITISCFRWGPGEWDGPHMPATLDDIQKVGATWMTFHPYASVGDDGSLRGYHSGEDPSVLVPLKLAKERGLRVMVKPHLGYWRSRFSWRGEIDFQDPVAIKRFFSHYQRWIVHQAILAERGGAALFCVGLEYQKLLKHEAAWRKIIAQVRGVFSGKLTYGAHHDTYHDVPFWDALDYVGVQAYIPISHARSPTDEQLQAGWDAVLDDVRAFSAHAGKPVVFTELGYADTPVAAREPWADGPRGEGGAELKLRCMRIALEAVHSEPAVEGVFLWKWFPSTRVMDREFILQYPEMKRVISKAWQ